MLLAGVLGGLINSFIADPKTETPPVWWKHIVLGVGAAFIVPVFLNMISSKLIAEIEAPPIDAQNLANLLILAGFCLVAAVSSRTFIGSITEKVLQQVAAAKRTADEAKKLAASAEGMAALAAPSDDAEDAVHEPVSSTPANAPKAHDVRVSDAEGKTLLAMISSGKSMRSITGIAEDAAIPKDQVSAAISSLIAKDLVAQGKNSDGKPRWYATPEGRVFNVEELK